LIELYDKNSDLKIESNSMNSIVQGTFFLFMTWMFFNASSGFTIVNREDTNIPQKIAMNTILAGSSGAVTTYFLKDIILR
jgi:ammonia channel protein AmtB